MNINDLGIWRILAIISIAGLLIFWKRKNAIWGGLTLGLIIGFIIVIIYLIMGNGFQFKIIGKSIIIGTLFGMAAEVLGLLSDKLKRK
ncbi:hypothetical protein [Flavobacterium sp. GSB-24]|uniref:hypothetical protein n=1 Tax=Flavobacterium sp. GSB-24 TaxID=2994319 RepID=UPI00248FCD5E|nr:hypothetical protein [Flavobacterium sp. GSB-24]BDU25397.1 hypothetical protein FLGSB24_21410 [Flavobacterium sp. GSB-24]